MMDGKEILKPCPFCGGEAYFDKDDHGWEWIECGRCHVATNQRVSCMEDCKPLLAEAWNTRTTVDLDAIRAEARAEGGKAAYNHAEVFHSRMVAAQEALMKYPSIVTKLVRGCYGIEVNEKQIAAWLEKELAAVLADEPKEREAEPCSKCAERKGAPPCEFCGPPAWEAYRDRGEMEAAVRDVLDGMSRSLDALRRSLTSWRAPEVTPAFMIYRDGDRYCAVTGHFRNLQDSASGWGRTPAGALVDLTEGRARGREGLLYRSDVDDGGR